MLPARIAVGPGTTPIGRTHCMCSHTGAPSLTLVRPHISTGALSHCMRSHAACALPAWEEGAAAPHAITRGPLTLAYAEGADQDLALLTLPRPRVCTGTGDQRPGTRDQGPGTRSRLGLSGLGLAWARCPLRQPHRRGWLAEDPHGAATAGRGGAHCPRGGRGGGGGGLAHPIARQGRGFRSNLTKRAGW